MVGGIPGILSFQAAVNTWLLNAFGRYQRDGRFYLCKLMLCVYNSCLLFFRLLLFLCAFLERLVIGLEPRMYRMVQWCGSDGFSCWCRWIIFCFDERVGLYIKQPPFSCSTVSLATPLSTKFLQRNYIFTMHLEPTLIFAVASAPLILTSANFKECIETVKVDVM